MLLLLVDPGLYEHVEFIAFRDKLGFWSSPALKLVEERKQLLSLEALAYFRARFHFH